MYDVIVVGGGPAGLGAALSAWEAGLRSILILEREPQLGGILNQCVHTGFGLQFFKEELSGPEYAQRFIDMVAKTGIEVHCDTTVLRISADKTVYSVSARYGAQEIQAKSIVLAMGCRERTRGQIGTPGDRPAGVLTAGAAQRFVNINGYLPGERIVVFGSGDIGLIMARRLTLEGAKVLACVEIQPQSTGLARNIAQCLDDFGIPLYLSHTITKITGKKRVESVTIAKVDENRAPVAGTEFVIECDTVLMSVGLIPENELTLDAGAAVDEKTNGAVVDKALQTTVPGIFACGNVVQVHDLADSVTRQAQKAGKAAAAYVKGVQA